MDNNQSNGLIAKNTILLYIRQIAIIGIYLFTSRIVLRALGVDDYGVYNVVGGVVAMFSFLMSTMSSASQRFLSIEIAKEDNVRLQETFSLTILTFLILAVVTIVIVESLAVWFLNTKMIIPAGRIIAANVVLQMSILSLIANIFSTPYMALIIAHEKMDAYAYISIIDAVLKLLIAYLLLCATYDKLILYSVLVFICSFVVMQIYRIYCGRLFKESHFTLFYDKSRLKELCSFAWWNMIGAIANLLRSHGINILLNLFFNPAVNAARAIAFQVNAAISTFSNNFYTSVRPQIMKSYATANTERMKNLIFVSSKLAFFLMLLLSLPIYLNAEKVLSLWLDLYPDYTVVFVKLVLVNALLEVFSMPLVAGLQATGKIKEFQMIVSVIYLFNIPISYILLRKGFSPETTLYVNMILVVIAFLPRLILCRKYFGLNIFGYIKSVLARCGVVAVVCYFSGQFLIKTISANNNIFNLFFNLSCLFLLVLLIVFIIGITPKERSYICNFVHTRMFI